MKFNPSSLFIVLFVVKCVRSDYKEVLEKALGNVTNKESGTECTIALHKLLHNILHPSLDDLWGYKMIDASSSLIPDGFLVGNIGNMGNFEECINIVSKDETIHGNYCLKLVIPLADKILNRTMLDLIDGMAGIPIALCLPSQCSQKEVNERFLLFPNFHFACQTKDDAYPPLSNGAIATICFLGFVIALMALSTTYDLYCRHYDKAPRTILLVFSIYTNTTKLFDMGSTSELSCISGIKFFSMLWITIGHVFTGYFFSPIMNVVDIFDYEQTVRAMFQHATTFAVDTFLCLGGFLLVYNFMKSMKSGRRFNIPVFYLHRYLRLTPALAALILVCVYLFDYLGSGPKWRISRRLFQEFCVKYWWSSLLYIQNYANEELEMCLTHTWYLSVDTQLYFLSPIFLILLWKYQTVGIIVILASIIGSIISAGYTGYKYELPALYNSPLIWRNFKDFGSKYYFVTHTRMSSWLIGALAGYIVYFLKCNKLRFPKMSHQMLIMCWAAVISLMLGCVFAGHDTMMDMNYKLWDSVLYLAFVRPVWSLCIAWMVAFCVLGHGGIINSFLSHKIFQVLCRFSYSYYLIHFCEITLRQYAVKTGTYFTEIDMLFNFWGHFAFSFGLSYIWVLAFESPVIALEKCIFGK